MDRHPHYVTRRYAHFAASLLALHSGLDDLVVGIGGEEMLLNDLATLRVEARGFVCIDSCVFVMLSALREFFKPRQRVLIAADGLLFPALSALCCFEGRLCRVDDIGRAHLTYT